MSDADLGALIAECDRPLTLASPDQARDIAARLIGSQRKADVVDPESFLAELGMLFAEHPAAIGHEVVGHLLRSSKWCPTISEVSEALNARMGRRAAVRWRADRLLAQRRAEAERAERDARIAAIPIEVRRAQADGLLATYREKSAP